MVTLIDAIHSSPTLFPLAMDEGADAVHFIGLAESEYSRASFLDTRVLQPNAPTALIPWPELSEATEALRIHCDYIFHISHTGSTLISRILGQHPCCFSLREPAVLRQLVEPCHAKHLPQLLGLLSRTFRPDQKALVKATSFVSQIGSNLLSRSASSRAILMHIPPETFLPALLDGAMDDIHSLAGARLQRLHCQIGSMDSDLSSLTPGEVVAMSWLCEYQSLSAIASQYPERTMWLNFEQFLVEPQIELERVQEFLGLYSMTDSLLASGLLRRYAKQTRVHYDQQFRQNLLDAANVKFATEIDRGLNWLAKHTSHCFQHPSIVQEHL